MCLCNGGGSSTREDAVALEGAEQSGGRSGGTGVDNGQGVAPRGPMCGKVVGGGRAEAQTPKPLGELGSAKALVWQGRPRARVVWPDTGLLLRRALLVSPTIPKIEIPRPKTGEKCQTLFAGRCPVYKQCLARFHNEPD